VLDSQHTRAARLAEAMTAAMPEDGPWTVQEVIGVALSRGLDSLDLAYPPGVDL
jgi:hypothetical protein